MQKRSVETRGRILKASQDLFSSSGYESASVEEICNAAGISKGAFYHHFPSKQSVFLELLGDWLEGIENGLVVLRGEQSDPALALIQMTEIFPEILQAAEGHLPIFLEFWAHAVREPSLWKEAVAPYRKYRDYFTQMMEEGVALGTLRVRDPETAAVAVLSLAIGLLLQGIVDADRKDWAQKGRESMRFLMEGMTRRSI